MPLALVILALAPLAGVLARVAVDPAAAFAVLAAPATRTALRHTLAAGAGATAIATLLGGVMALACALTDLRLKRALGAVFVLLLLMPAQVTALAWTDLLSPSSPLLAPLGLAPRAGHPNPLFGGAGIALLLGIEQAPLVFLLFAAGLRAIPAAQVMAARSLGARPVRVLL
ncbi:MAG TPA: iron ABC transporter permease, partial [Acetobacteraceae bacterium]|nr:iron ABC transporter permease [Acetobacteraceae bacterium]